MGVNFARRVHIISCCNSYFNAPSSVLSSLNWIPRNLASFWFSLGMVARVIFLNWKISCHYSPNPCLKHLNGFQLLGKRSKLETWPTSPKMLLSPLQSHFITWSYCVYIFRLLQLCHPFLPWGPCMSVSSILIAWTPWLHHTHSRPLFGSCISLL